MKPIAGTLLILMAALQIFAASSSFANGNEHKVVIVGMKFVPETLHVQVGDTITWTNEDLVPHTATASDKKFDSGAIQPDRAWQMKVTSAGTIKYVCTYHPTMAATLVAK